MKKSTKSDGWVHIVVMRYAFGFGLTTGVAVPLLNALIQPDPDYNILQALAFAVPFFVTAWSFFGIYMWRKENHTTTR